MNILIIGNGFDIAHSLPTSYGDFLKMFKLVNKAFTFSSALEKVKAGDDYKGEFKEFINKYEDVMKQINISKIKEMEYLLENNSWASYYAGCEAEIKGWIDFEKEMLPVFELFKQIFDKGKDASITESGGIPSAQIRIDNEMMCKRAELMPKYFKVRIQEKIVGVSNGYSGSTYGVFKEKILSDLKKELDDFIEAFRIYLNEVVDRIEITENSVIKSIKADVVISFNYTNTERKYLPLANIYHIHGNIDKKDSLVLGVNKVEADPNNEFIYFVKYFQRIRRRLDRGYTRLFDMWEIDSDPNYNVVIYGHSLDKTDEDVIRSFLEKANNVIIYYYNDEDYEHKVINLISMFGRQTVEEYIDNGTIEFMRTDGSSM